MTLGCVSAGVCALNLFHLAAPGKEQRERARAKVIFCFSLLCIPQQLCAELREAIIALKARAAANSGLLHAAFQ